MELDEAVQGLFDAMDRERVQKLVCEGDPDPSFRRRIRLDWLRIGLDRGRRAGLDRPRRSELSLEPRRGKPLVDRRAAPRDDFDRSIP